MKRLLFLLILGIVALLCSDAHAQTNIRANNITATGNLAVSGTSTVGPVNAVGNVATSPALGATGGALNVQKTTGGTAIYNGRLIDAFGNTNQQIIGLDIEQLLNPSLNVNYLTFGQVTEMATPLTNTANFTGGDQTATYGSFSHYGSGTMVSLSGITGEGFNSGPATVTVVKGATATANCGGPVVNGIPGLTLNPTNNGSCANLRAFDGIANNKSSGAVTNAVDFYAEAVTNTGGGSTINAFGLFVADQTHATNNFAIKTGAGKVEIGDVALFDSTGQFVSTVGIGSAPSASVALLIQNPFPSGTSQFGVQSALSTSSAATVEGSGMVTRADTAAAAYTQALNTGLHVTTPVVGAGSAITEWDGVRIDAAPAAGTKCSEKVFGSTSGSTCINTSAVAGGTASWIISTSFTTTAATTDNVTVTGMTSTGHCALEPTNSGAAGGIASVFVSAKAANQITVTHTATSGWTFDVMCSPI